MSNEGVFPCELEDLYWWVTAEQIKRSRKKDKLEVLFYYIHNQIDKIQGKGTAQLTFFA